jgi:hypothetical protein
VIREDRRYFFNYRMYIHNLASTIL